MSRKERRRLVVLNQLQGGKVSLVKAAELLGLSYPSNEAGLVALSE